MIQKREATMIFMGIAFMAIVVAFFRFQSAEFALGPDTPGTSQQAVVVASGDEYDEAAVTDALLEAVTPQGELEQMIIDDVHIGTGPAVQDGDTITVHYIGTTEDGVQFDNSYERGKPFIFTVGKGRVIAGWEQGVLGMQVGGKRILVIPPSLAYGNAQVGPIEAGANLVFAIELLSIE